MSAVPKGSSAVMAQKRPRLSEGEVWQKLELFPTPPWATRALFLNALPVLGKGPGVGRVWEPCAGLGHMAVPLGEFASDVFASDVYGYAGRHESVLGGVDFLDRDRKPQPGDEPDWIVTNPPFSASVAMLDRALDLARVGVALLLRLQWIETEGRYDNVFATRAPTLFAPFAERVPMCEGGWDPDCDTATAYAWFIWIKDRPALDLSCAGGFLLPRSTFPTFIIPPGRELALTRESDRSLAALCVPGFEPPSRLKRQGRATPAML